MNIQQLQSYSFSLEYMSYEKKTYEIQAQNDENELINTVIQSEKYQKYRLDIEIFTGKNLNGQSSSFKPAPLTDVKPKFNNPDMELFGKDGYWGVEKTAGRIIDFVLNGAGDQLDKLKQGREGVLRGLKEAEKSWGGELPDISYATIEKALEDIDKKISELGGNVVDVSA